MLDTNRIVKIQIPLENGKKLRLSAYIIGNGMLITCRHGFISATGYANEAAEVISIEGKSLNIDLKNAKNIEGLIHNEIIVFESEEYDIALIECKEVKGDFYPINLDNFQSPEEWRGGGYPFFCHTEKSEGYTDVNGTIASVAPNKSKIELKVTNREINNMDDWKEISGSPIFVSNKLTGIIIKRTGTVENELQATRLSILWNDPEQIKFKEILNQLQEADYGDGFTAYQQENRERFDAHLAHIESDNTKLFKALPTSVKLLADLSKSPVDCIKSLKEKCSGFTGEVDKKDIEELFYLLLTQIKTPCRWQGTHLHELNVSTRLLAELSVAKLYNVSPKFADSDKLQGKHVIPASQIELGFDIKDEAEEQANNIAYALYKKWGNEGLTEKSLMENHQGYGEVDELLKVLREDDDAVFRFEINEESTEAKDHPLLRPEVRDYIHQHLLPDLPIVLYGKQGASSFEDEGRLQTHVNLFVKKILSV